MAKLTKLEAEHFEKIKEVYHHGGHDIEVCKALGITLRNLDTLYNASDTFADFIDMGRLYSRAWWYEQGRKNIENTKFNTTMYSFQMKNLHGWADKSEQVVTDNSEPKSLDEAASTLKKMFPEILRMIDPEYANLTEAQLLERTSGVN
jgi:hypothetical protein